MLDIFNNNAFGVTSLTDTVNSLKYIPTRIAELGLFRASSVSTTSIAIERMGDMLQLVKPTPRGGPGETRDMPKRNLKAFTIPHFQRDWAVYADEVQGVRAYGSETQLKTVAGVVKDKMDANLGDFTLTEEHARLGAITGNIVYADGSGLNLFTEFGVTQAAEVAFNLDAADPVDGALRKACTGIIRATRKELGRVPFDHVHAFCGDNFFDKLLESQEVRDTYKGWNQAQILRDSYVGKSRGSNPMYKFGDIVWENYGAVEDDGFGIDTEKVRFFPIGVPNLFRTYYAPADYIETVNTMGKRLYAKQWTMQNGKGINGEMQMNELNLCTRPKVLLRGRSGA